MEESRLVSPSLAPQQEARWGAVVVARSDPRLLRTTLGALERQERRPDLISVVVPAGREHVFSNVIAEARSVTPVRTVGAGLGAVTLDQAFRGIAGEVDFVLFIQEGVIPAPDYLDVLAERTEAWDDLIGEIAIVACSFKFSAAAPLPALEDIHAKKKERNILPRLCQFLRARSVMASMLWVRVAACGGIRFAPIPEPGCHVTFALFLDRLQMRGRTALGFTDRARHLRPLPERRSGFESGYELIRSLVRVADLDERRMTGSPGQRSYLNERAEIIRLLAEHALQILVSPRSKRSVLGFLQGLWAGWRDARMQRRSLRREIRELS